MSHVWIGVFGLILTALPVNAAQVNALSKYAAVQVDPAKTSIYVGSVALTMPDFQRQDSTYVTTYSAKVFPYFFSSEKGNLWIKIADADLRRLERGETVEFEGRARNEQGKYRGISGRAVPIDANHGKLKVRVFVTEKIELIFNTTYRFTENSRG